MFVAIWGDRCIAGGAGCLDRGALGTGLALRTVAGSDLLPQ